MVSDKIEKQIVVLLSLREIFFRIIDYAIGPDRSHHFRILVAADGGDFRAEGLRDLHGKRPDSARRAVDQNLLAGLDFSLVAQSLQGREGRDRDSGGLF